MTEADQRRQRRPRAHYPETGLAPQQPERLAETCLVLLRSARRVAGAAWRLTQGQQHDQRHQHPGDSQREEDEAPTEARAPLQRLGKACESEDPEQFDHALVGELRDGATDEACQCAADGDAHRVGTDRASAVPRPEEVADDGIGGRRTAGLADRDADARDQKEHEAGGEAAKRGHHRPYRDAEREQADAVPAIRGHRERDAHQGIKERKGRAVQEAVLRVREVELRDDRLRHHPEQLAVDEVERVDRQQRKHHITPIAGGADVAAVEGFVVRRCDAHEREDPPGLRVTRPVPRIDRGGTGPACPAPPGAYRRRAVSVALYRSCRSWGRGCCRRPNARPMRCGVPLR